MPASDSRTQRKERLLTPQERRRLRQQIQDWAGQMMAVTPIEGWGIELGRLLTYWIEQFGLIFPKATLDALQQWMLKEQELALEEEESAAGRRELDAITGKAAPAGRLVPSTLVGGNEGGGPSAGVDSGPEVRVFPLTARRVWNTKNVVTWIQANYSRSEWSSGLSQAVHAANELGIPFTANDVQAAQDALQQWKEQLDSWSKMIRDPGPYGPDPTVPVDRTEPQEPSVFSFPPDLPPEARVALEAQIRAGGGVTQVPTTPTPPLVPSGAYSAAADPFSPAFDPRAATMQHNWEFLSDFWKGTGQSERVYGPDTIQTFQMRQSPGAAKLRDAFYASGCRDVIAFAYSTGEAARETVLRPIFSGGDLTDTAAQVGGFADAIALNNGDGTVTFTIRNFAGAHSFFLHAVPNRRGTAGRWRTIRQTFRWTEIIDKSRTSE